MIIPRIGLWTWQLTGDQCYTTIRQALDLGYRHIDTAHIYRNEQIIGEAIWESGVDRTSLWLTSKIFTNHYHSAQLVQDSIRQSLNDLQTDYLDLVLLHWPTTEEHHHLVFDTLLNLKSQGIIYNIGVSNFTRYQFLDAIDYTDHQISFYQWEYHVCLDQNILLSTCKEHNIIFEAYSPLAHGKLWNHTAVITILQNIAHKHHCSISQIMLAWLYQQGVVILPKSTQPQHLLENSMIDQIRLDHDDLLLISWFPKNFRYCNPVQIAPIWD